ncbi:MBL fold metallo-hydrolase [Sphaerotilus sp.]|uniref:MBL fold metallo-hydrolase n=1 Tax=Sphaerotilus sp. TaxID=2093942 RepID=UPI002ACE13B7|nr:MBL fold metallo-hydrolase [Sphaerotilus sp.]MDZ7854889.1 MBL fold metallo-hydrolase [Sphaerotilus sp.]
MSSPKLSPQPLTRRGALGRMGLGLGGVLGAGLAVLPEARLLAAQAGDFLTGPPVADVKPRQLSPHVWLLYAQDGFPTPENRGLMASMAFVVTSAGVVVLDTGASLQIGEMAIRMIRTVTPKPVIAVFNSHYHGDHWLGNHAFAQTFGADLPIHALPHTVAQIRGAEGSLWRSLMERWTNQATVGTEVVVPNREVTPGQRLRFGDVTLVMHHHGTAHTPSDLCVQVVEDGVTHVGDIAMTNRIANLDDGSYAGTFRYYAAMQALTGPQLWVPGHGEPARDLLDAYGRFLAGIWEPCVQAVKDGRDEAAAKAMVLRDPRVATRAKTMAGFDSNIGKYVSLAYLEAEKEAF